MRADLLHVVGCYFNHRRNPHLLRNAKAWVERTLAAGVHVTMVEHQIGDRPFELAPRTGLNLVQLRGHAGQEVWLKEALLKVGLARLPDTAKHICWEDADVEHTRHDWAAETVQMLQHHRLGQTWVHAMDLDGEGNIMTNEWGHDVDRSFSAAFVAGDTKSPIGGVLSKPPAEGYADPRQHYGYSWAARRDVLDSVGMIDWLVTGSADYHMALAFAGRQINVLEDASPGYRRRLNEFRARCDEFVRQDIGVVPGAILAHYHGPKQNRFYISRNDILLKSGFDPDKDLAYGLDGLPHLVNDNRVLRDGLRRYFMRRNEV